MRRFRAKAVVYFGCLFLFVVLSSGCGDATLAPTLTPRPTPAILNVGVSSSAAAMIALVEDPYAAHNEQAHVNFVVGNNRTLFDDLAAGELDAIFVHHIIDGNQDWFNPVALDGVVVVTHPANGVQGLDLAQVQSIFSGQIGNWADAAGADLSVQTVGREQGADARIVFNRRVMAEQRLSIHTLVASDDEALLEAVAQTPGAAGYTMMSAVSGEVVPLSINGVAPSPQTTAAQEYPLTTPLYFVSREEPTGQLRAFLAWMQSEAGQTHLGEKFGPVS